MRINADSANGTTFAPGSSAQSVFLSVSCLAAIYFHNKEIKMSVRCNGTIHFAITLTLLAALIGQPAKAEDWPRWRGPGLDGISKETGLLQQWPTDGPRQLWRATLSGGFSSVVVADGRLFTQTKEKNQEIVVCLDAASGNELWRFRYDCDYGAHRSFTGGGMPASRTGPRTTPVVEGDRVYTLGATGILLCLEAKTGKEVWRQDLLKIAGRECPTHGYCGSPLVAGDRIFLQTGGSGGKSVAALDKRDGRIVWQALDEVLGQGSPVWAVVRGTPQVIFFAGKAVIGVAPQDGRLLWRYPWTTRFDLNIATPICTDDKVFISSNYGTGGALIRIMDTNEPETVWKTLTMQNHISTSVLYQGSLYGFSEQRLRCVDFTTGQVKWDKPGLGRGSVVVADGHVIILGDHGQMVLAKATPAAYTELSRCQVFDKGTLTWTVPVVSGGRLYIRSENALLALDLRGEP
jgi:outer membrane protein assembly factor BamB